MSGTPHDPDGEDARPLGLREALGGVLAAAFGVRSHAARERDFRRGSARQYVVLGLIATAVFVLAVYAVVRLVIALASG